MNNYGEDVLIPIIAIISAVALPIIACGYILFLLIKSRNKERMELIKQGIIPSSQPKAIPNKYTSLRNGFICVGLSLGIILGLVFQKTLNLDTTTSILTITSSVLLFLGIAYLAFYFTTKSKNFEE